MQGQVQEMRKKVSTRTAVLIFWKHVSHSVSELICVSGLEKLNIHAQNSGLFLTLGNSVAWDKKKDLEDRGILESLHDRKQKKKKEEMTSNIEKFWRTCTTEWKKEEEKTARKKQLFILKKKKMNSTIEEIPENLLDGMFYSLAAVINFTKKKETEKIKLIRSGLINKIILRWRNKEGGGGVTAKMI